MIAHAIARPRTGFIGIEPFANGMAKALAAIERETLTNVRLHFEEAASLIAWLPDASVDRVDLIHPDPWPKRRHWKHRFVQDATIAQLARILRQSGELRFATDVADYAAWTLQRLLRAPAFDWTGTSAAALHLIGRRSPPTIGASLGPALCRPATTPRPRVKSAARAS